jgi:hypothetical protein
MRALRAGYFVDVGAMHIHGIDDNPIVRLCERENLSILNMNGSHHEIQLKLFDHDGSRVPTTMDDTIAKKFNDLLDLTQEIGNKVGSLT